MPGMAKKSKIQKAQANDKKEKITADKTFGLKNKKKSKKVQQYVARRVPTPSDDDILATGNAALCRLFGARFATLTLNPNPKP